MPLKYQKNFQQFVANNYKDLCLLARKYETSVVPAEAIVNEYSLKDWGKFQYLGPGQLAMWCSARLQWLARDLIRKHEGGKDKDDKPRKLGDKLRPVSLPDNWESETPNSDPAMAAESAESALKLKQAIAKLPDDQRIVLKGKILEGLPMTEMALRLNRKVSEIKTLFDKAIESLRRDLDSLGHA